MSDIQLGFAFLFAQTASSLVVLFWYTVVFEIPRYILPFVAAALTMRDRPEEDEARAKILQAFPSVSIILIGHNEEDALEACVRSLHEQSFNNFEIIIVSDGSTDRMSAVARSLVARGLATKIVTTDLRGGKSSGINLACKSANGEIVINVDCDCSFDRYAVERLLEPFDDPSVAAVCGDIAPRNGHVSLISQIQEIEYLQSISVGKRIANAVDQVVCASGAFSAFRRTALESVRGFDVGGGEDLDVTLRLRGKGWRIVYAPGAICYTDVPTNAFQYIRQRLRWERDAVWIRFRKHRRLFNPFDKAYRPSEMIHQWDFLLFNVLGAVIFPLYILWLFLSFGSFAIAILIGMQVGLLVLDVIVLFIGAWTTGRPVFWRNLPFLPGYAAFMTFVMRPVRLLAYIDEWVLSGSHRDNYTPSKVRLERPW